MPAGAGGVTSLPLRPATAGPAGHRPLAPLLLARLPAGRLPGPPPQSGAAVVSRHLIDVEYYTHTCPADRSPHVVAERRTVVAVTDTGPCTNPLTVRCGPTVAEVDCGRRLPTHRQCPGCRPIVMVGRETTVHLGRETPSACRPPTGLAERPCRLCRHPLAAELADRGRHMLCGPPPGGAR